MGMDRWGGGKGEMEGGLGVRGRFERLGVIILCGFILEGEMDRREGKEGGPFHLVMFGFCHVESLRMRTVWSLGLMTRYVSEDGSIEKSCA